MEIKILLTLGSLRPYGPLDPSSDNSHGVSAALYMFDIGGQGSDVLGINLNQKYIDPDMKNEILLTHWGSGWTSRDSGRDKTFWKLANCNTRPSSWPISSNY